MVSWLGHRDCRTDCDEHDSEPAVSDPRLWQLFSCLDFNRHYLSMRYLPGDRLPHDLHRSADADQHWGMDQHRHDQDLPRLCRDDIRDDLHRKHATCRSDADWCSFIYQQAKDNTKSECRDVPRRGEWREDGKPLVAGDGSYCCLSVNSRNAMLVSPELGANRICMDDV